MQVHDGLIVSLLLFFTLSCSEKQDESVASVTHSIVASDRQGGSLATIELMKVRRKESHPDSVNLQLSTSIRQNPLMGGPGEKNVLFDWLSGEDGLPQNSIMQLHVDSEGFLWICYANGILRYDGYDFVYLDEIGTYHSPRGTGKIHEDEYGGLWFPTVASDAAIILYRRHNGVAYELDLFTEEVTYEATTIVKVGEEQSGQKVLLRSDWAFVLFDYKNLILPTDTNFIAPEHTQGLITEVINIPPEFRDSTSRFGHVPDMIIDAENTIWFISPNGLGKYDLETRSFQLFPLESGKLNADEYSIIVEGEDGVLWLGGEDGIFKFDRKSLEYTKIPFPDEYRDNARLVLPYLSELDSRGLMLMTARSFQWKKQRLYWFDPVTGSFTRIADQNPDEHGFSGVYAVCNDDFGNYWIGTRGSIYCTNSEKNLFAFYQTDSLTGGLPSPDFYKIYEDQDNIVWFGLSDGVLTGWDRTDNTFQYMKHSPDDPNSLLPGQIWDILRDSHGTLWIASQTGLNRQNPDGTFRHYQHDPADSTSLRSNDVAWLFEDSNQNLWVTIYRDDLKSILHRYDPSCDCFESRPNLDSLFVYAIAEDKEGILWLSDAGGSSSYGLNSYDPAADVIQFHHRFSNQTANDIYVDQSGNIWETGFSNLPLIKYEPGTGTIKAYDLLGLYPTNPLRTVLEDEEGKFWLAGAKGMIHFDPVTEAVINLYSPQNWMPAGVNWISRIGGIKTRDGTFVLASSTGFLTFHPRDIDINQQLPQTAITGIEALGSPVRTVASAKLVQHAFRDDVELPYRRNDLTIHYTGLHLKEPGANQFAYQLVGWDNDWITARTQRTASYSNLDAGKYTFRVKASNSDGLWMRDKDAVTLNIHILPPWYATWWAYVCYALAFISGLSWIRHKELEKQRAKVRLQEEKLQQQEEVNEQLVRLDLLKDQFLANTSHELRTPLNGIIGIAESLKDGIAGQLSQKATSNLNVIISSGNRLANLVNDVLDFSKLKNKDLALRLRPVDMRSAVDVVLTLSEAIIQHKELTLINNIPQDVPLVEADENRVQQILHNLVGNAIKFTEQGTVSIGADVKDGVLRISVADSGIGISEDKFERIFLSFEQADGSTAREYGGTGLGLSVTRQLVELHGGNVSLKSEIGVGSTFSFTLPLSQVTREDLPDLEFAKGAESVITVAEPVTAAEEQVVPIALPLETAQILIVDDEPVNLQVLENHLGLAGYAVTKAGSGSEALKIIQRETPFDLIILDIMMPGMSGYEVCHKLRDTYLPGELPVIMLTAKNRVTDLVEGFSVGANDYLTKPFSKDELLSRIKMHLNLHRIHRTTGKFVPFEFLRALGRESISEVQLGDHTQREVTIFFSDIRDFTSLSERMTPDQNFQFINRYVGAMGPIVRKHGGFINQYLGDGIMAVFPKQLDHALLAAIEMQHNIQELNRSHELQINVGMGLHVGPLIMGIIGDEHRYEPATIDDTVNVASRMEGLTKHYGANIIVTENCLQSLDNKDQFHFRYFGKVQVKGKTQAIGAYECIDGDAPAIKDLKLKDLQLYEEGMQNYYTREFADATAIFNSILKSNAEDHVAEYFRNSSARFTVNGVADDWDGVEKSESK